MPNEITFSDYQATLTQPKDSPKLTIIMFAGPGEDADPVNCERAFNLARMVADEGFVVATGGRFALEKKLEPQPRHAGVMDAAMAGARSVGGLTLGILPGQRLDPKSDSSHGLLRIPSGVSEARDMVLVGAADVVVICGANPGTWVEASYAAKLGDKPTILMTDNPDANEGYFEACDRRRKARVAENEEEAFAFIQGFIPKDAPRLRITIGTSSRA